MQNGNLQGLVKQSMQGAPGAAPSESEEEMLLRVLQASQQRQPNPASASPYAAGMQQQEGLSPNPFRGNMPDRTQQLIQQAMMDELARQQQPRPQPASLPSQVKRPPGM